MGTMANMVAAQQQPFNLQQAAQDYARQAVYGNKTLAGMEGQSMMPAYRAMMGGNRALQLAQLDTSGAQNVGEGVLKGLGNVIRLGQASSMRRQQEEDQQGLAAMMQSEADRREAMLRQYETAAADQLRSDFTAGRAILPQTVPDNVVAAAVRNPELFKSLMTGVVINPASTTAASEAAGGNFMDALSTKLGTTATGQDRIAAEMAMSKDPEAAALGRAYFKARGVDFTGPEAIQTAQEGGKQAVIQTKSAENILAAQPTKIKQEIQAANLANEGAGLANDSAREHLKVLPQELQNKLDQSSLAISNARTEADQLAALRQSRADTNEALTKQYGPNWSSNAEAVGIWNAQESIATGKIIKPEAPKAGQFVLGNDGEPYVWQKGKNGAMSLNKTDWEHVPAGALKRPEQPALNVNDPLGQQAAPSKSQSVGIPGVVEIKAAGKPKSARDKNAQSFNKAVMGVLNTANETLAKPIRNTINAQQIFGSQKEAEMFIKRNRLTGVKAVEKKGSDGSSFGWRVE